jgi:hypothetical protein
VVCDDRTPLWVGKAALGAMDASHEVRRRHSEVCEHLPLLLAERLARRRPRVMMRPLELRQCLGHRVADRRWLRRRACSSKPPTAAPRVSVGSADCQPGLSRGSIESERRRVSNSGYTSVPINIPLIRGSVTMSCH